MNRFAECKIPEELMAQIVGAGSTCWIEQKSGFPPFLKIERVFDSDMAAEIVQEGLDKMKKLVYKEIIEGLESEIANENL